MEICCAERILAFTTHHIMRYRNFHSCSKSYAYNFRITDDVVKADTLKWQALSANPETSVCISA